MDPAYFLIIVVIVVAVIGYFVTSGATGSDGWYNDINKAPWSPPNWTFAVVWTILYVFIAWAWVVSNLDEDLKTNLSINYIFAFNIFINLAWSFVFFQFKMGVTALLLILLLILSCALLIYFLRSNILLTVFMSCYLAWLCVAFSLNYYTVANNPEFAH